MLRQTSCRRATNRREAGTAAGRAATENLDEGHAIQDATVALLNETVGGWKTGLDKAGTMSRAPIFKDDIQANPGRVGSSNTNLRGIEAEIAFRFTKDLPARDSDYSRGEVEDAMEAFAAIELLNSRYADPRPLSTLEKLADRIIQGGIVCGTPRQDWRSIDWSKLEVVLTVDGTDIASGTGSHPVGDRWRRQSPWSTACARRRASRPARS